MPVTNLHVSALGGSATSFTDIRVEFDVSGCEEVQIQYSCGPSITVPIQSGAPHTETVVVPNTTGCTCADPVEVTVQCTIGDTGGGSSSAKWTGNICCPRVTNATVTQVTTTCVGGMHTMALAAQVTVAPGGATAIAQWLWDKAVPAQGGSLAVAVPAGPPIAVVGTHAYLPGTYTAQVVVVGCPPVDVPVTVPVCPAPQPCCAPVTVSTVCSGGQVGATATFTAQLGTPAPPGCSLTAVSHKWVVKTPGPDTWEASTGAATVATTDAVWTNTIVAGVQVQNPVPNQVLPLAKPGTYSVAVAVVTGTDCLPSNTDVFSLTGETTPPTLAGPCGFVMATGAVTAVRLTFSEPMDAGTVTDVANYLVTVVPQGGQPLALTPTAAAHDANQYTVDLSGFASPIPAGAQVTVTISGVTDLAGNPIAAGTMTTCTVPGGDATPPQPADCSFTTDAAGAVTGVLVRFSEQVNAATAADPANYTVTVDGNQVPPGSTSASYDLATMTTTLTGFATPAGAQVTVVVAGVTDLAGNPVQAGADTTSCVAPTPAPTPSPPSGGCFCTLLLVVAMALIALGAVLMLIWACSAFINGILFAAATTLLSIGLVVLLVWVVVCRDCPAVSLLIKVFAVLAVTLPVIAALVAALGMPLCAVGLLIIAAAFGTIAAALAVAGLAVGCPPSLARRP